jgi:hypothetical protein
MRVVCVITARYSPFAANDRPPIGFSQGQPQAAPVNPWSPVDEPTILGHKQSGIDGMRTQRFRHQKRAHTVGSGHSFQERRTGYQDAGRL